MNKKTIVQTARYVGMSRHDLTKVVNKEINDISLAMEQFNARIISTSLGNETPYGPLGNWSQNLTVIIEGDYDDPVFKAFYDDYQKRQLNQRQSGGCYIATCVYGSYDCPQVWTLRRFRDYTLDATWYGKVFIKCYYAISPTLVKCFGNQKWFKTF